MQRPLPGGEGRPQMGQRRDAPDGTGGLQLATSRHDHVDVGGPARHQRTEVVGVQVRQVAGDDEHVRRRVPIGEAFQHGEDARQRALTRDDVGHEVEAERCELVGVTARGNHRLAADGGRARWRPEPPSAPRPPRPVPSCGPSAGWRRRSGPHRTAARPGQGRVLSQPEFLTDRAGAGTAGIARLRRPHRSPLPSRRVRACSAGNLDSWARPNARTHCRAIHWRAGRRGLGGNRPDRRRSGRWCRGRDRRARPSHRGTGGPTPPPRPRLLDDPLPERSSAAARSDASSGSGAGSTVVGSPEDRLIGWSLTSRSVATPTVLTVPTVLA